MFYFYYVDKCECFFVFVDEVGQEFEVCINDNLKGKMDFCEQISVILSVIDQYVQENFGVLLVVMIDI